MNRKVAGLLFAILLCAPLSAQAGMALLDDENLQEVSAQWGGEWGMQVDYKGFRAEADYMAYVDLDGYPSTSNRGMLVFDEVTYGGGTVSGGTTGTMDLSLTLNMGRASSGGSGNWMELGFDEWAGTIDISGTNHLGAGTGVQINNGWTSTPDAGWACYGLALENFSFGNQSAIWFKYIP